MAEEIIVTSTVFKNLSSDGVLPCPICGDIKTHPYGNCGCPPTNTGYGTRHINNYHHSCQSLPIPNKCPKCESEIVITEKEHGGWFIKCEKCSIIFDIADKKADIERNGYLYHLFSTKKEIIVSWNSFTEYSKEVFENALKEYEDSLNKKEAENKTIDRRLTTTERIFALFILIMFILTLIQVITH